MFARLATCFVRSRACRVDVGKRNTDIERFKQDTSTLSLNEYSSGLTSPFPYADTEVAPSSSETPNENGRKRISVQAGEERQLGPRNGGDGGDGDNDDGGLSFSICMSFFTWLQKQKGQPPSLAYLT